MAQALLYQPLLVFSGRAHMMTTPIEVLFVVSLVAPVLAVLIGIVVVLTPRRAKPARTAETRAAARG